METAGNTETETAGNEVSDYPGNRGPFSLLLAWHLDNGTRPDGAPKNKGLRPWTPKEFAGALGKTDTRSVRGWRNGEYPPQDLITIERVLFGDNRSFDRWRTHLREVHKEAKERGKAPKKRRKSPSTSQTAVSPYPGLRPFTPEEAAFFFGRQQQTTKIVSLIREYRLGFLALVGDSASGKSSLVYAGVLPSLRAGKQEWPVVAFTPGFASDNPFTPLAVELVRREVTTRTTRPADLAAKLETNPESFYEYARAILNTCPNAAALIIFIDQFEELFRDTAEKHKRSFIKLVTTAAQNPNLRVLITLRIDFLSQFLADPELAELVQQPGALFPVGSPTHSQLEAMIREPARVANLELQDEVAEAILKEAGTNPGEALSLIAFCLKELHRHTGKGHAITLDTYRQLGGLKGVIGQWTAGLLLTIESDKYADLESTLAKIFRLLVHVDAAGKTVRQWVSLEAVKSLPAPASLIIEALINDRLLVVAMGEGPVVIALSHEALIQEWSLLREWFEKNHAQMQRVQRHLLLLTAPEVSDRRHAAKALAQMGPTAAEASKALVVALADEDAEVRVNAAISLAEIGETGALEAVPGLLATLRYSDRRAFRKAIEVLYFFQSAIPALKIALNDKNAAVRAGAAEALGNFGPKAKEEAPALIGALVDEDENVRWQAGFALMMIGVSAVPALSRTLRNANSMLRERVAGILADIGTDALEAVPELSAALGDDNRNVRRNAARALRNIAPTDPAAIAALARALGDYDPEILEKVAQALGKIGRAAREAIQGLIGVLNDPNANVRKSAAIALSEIAPEEEIIVAALCGALGDDDKSIRHAAAKGLARTETIGIELLPELIAALSDNDEYVRRIVVKAIGKMGSATSNAIEVLQNVIENDRDIAVKMAAVDAINQIEKLAP